MLTPAGWSFDRASPRGRASTHPERRSRRCPMGFESRRTPWVRSGFRRRRSMVLRPRGRAENFPISGQRFPQALHPGSGVGEASVRPDQCRARGAGPESGRGHRRRRGGGGGREVGPGVRPGHLPDWLRDLHQHERQRGDRHGEPTSFWRPGGRPDPPERSCEPRPVLQRRHSHAHPHGGPSGPGGGASSRLWKPCTEPSWTRPEAFDGDPEIGTHPPHGRYAGSVSARSSEGGPGRWSWGS